jgi:hypothetical protein
LGCARPVVRHAGGHFSDKEKDEASLLNSFSEEHCEMPSFSDLRSLKAFSFSDFALVSQP